MIEAGAARTSLQAAEAVLLDRKAQKKLFSYARSHFGIPAVDAEDLLGETVLELVRRPSYIRKPDGFLFAVFHSRCVRFAADRKTRGREISIEGSPGDRASASALPEATYRQVALREALAFISRACRRLLTAYFFEGQSLKEAASTASLRYSSMAKSISRCVEQLRKYLR